MAHVDLRSKENVAGEFFVDSTCIDCDSCRQIAPAIFHDVGEQSAVYKQPENPAETFQALKALVTCPTASIGTISKHNAQKAARAFPEPIEGPVHFCGYASESSYGASSYLIVRSEGNVLVDSPRFAAPLARRIEELGGIHWMFLTHRDDVADHRLWKKHFGLKRITHKDDASALGETPELEISGAEPVSIAPDLLVIPTPGHTRGHCVLLYDNRFLFTGDHLWWSVRFRGLHASRSVNWYSWKEQVRSVERLRDYSFEWVLPGHGRRFHADPETMQQALRDCVHRINRS